MRLFCSIFFLKRLNLNPIDVLFRKPFNFTSLDEVQRLSLQSVLLINNNVIRFHSTFSHILL